MSLRDLHGSALFSAMVALREQERASWSAPSSGKGEQNDDERDAITVFHSTSRARAESIVREGFRFPAPEEGPARGLKLGAAVYFGTDRRYCEHEALNTLEDAAREERGSKRLGQAGRKKLRAELRTTLATVTARVLVKKRLSLGDYDGWVRKRGVNTRAFDEATERISCEVLGVLGDYDVITINEGTPAFEVAVYAPAAMVPESLELLPPTPAATAEEEEVVSSGSGSGSDGSGGGSSGRRSGDGPKAKGTRCAIM